jgi:hypothetical protein
MRKEGWKIIELSLNIADSLSFEEIEYGENDMENEKTKQGRPAKAK